ncbi:MAG: hypothetical protein QI223_09960 [Candidatus Korarchaeota archaeon]|nr:hypothetical protein [Candidatus Korarchaeota archaeon]
MGGRVQALINGYLEGGLSYGDALAAAEDLGAEILVTWSKRHLSGRIPADVVTPEEFLAAGPERR